MTPKDTDQALVDRAMAAYFRTESGTAQQPANNSDVYTLEQKRYVVLRNINGPLAVYRIRNDGILRRMRRWPKQIAD